MKYIKVLAAIGLYTLISSCDKFDAGNISKSVYLTFDAVISNESVRTQLDDTSVLWSPGDQIKIFQGTSSSGIFTSTASEPSVKTTFEGSLSVAIGAMESSPGEYNFWAVYPSNVATGCDGKGVTLKLNAFQQGVEGTFDQGSFPSVARSDNYALAFYNVCGGLQFSLSRDDIKRVTFESNGHEALAGEVDVTFDNGVPTATAIEAETKIVLTPKSGKTFAKGGKYYIVSLPVSMKEGFTMTFETETQIGTFKFEKEISISRSTFGKKENIDSYATFVESDGWDLSGGGTANCYIVSDSGRYKFRTVQGNTTTSVGAVAKAEVLWESFGTDVIPQVGELVDVVSYENGYIKFKANNKKGNAVIAAKDASDNILWSWHIWLTDVPGEQIYNNNAGTMMDRNLGATSATPEDVRALGLLYQWGRKDPFLSGNAIDSYDQEAASTITWPDAVESTSSTGTIDYAVKHPTTFITSNRDWYYTGSSSTDDNRWQMTDKPKGIYDPCPTGWRVPSSGRVWARALGRNSSDISSYWSGTDKGVDFGKTDIKLGEGTIWYPSAGYRDNYAGLFFSAGEYGRYWSCTPAGASSAYMLSFSYSYPGDYYDGRVLSSSYARSYGNSVRCYKEGTGSNEAVGVQSITLDVSNLKLLVKGDSAQIFATVLPSTAENRKVIWTSSDNAVATVDGGMVTAVSRGTATITATTVDGGIRANCGVTVLFDCEAAMTKVEEIYNNLSRDKKSRWYSQGAYPTFCIHLAALSDDFVFTYDNVMFRNTAEWVRHRDLAHKYNDLNHYWSLFYNVVDKSNKILSYIDEVPSRTGDENVRWCVKGQALALRAFAYHQLVQAWAERYYPEKAGRNDQPGVVLRLDDHGTIEGVNAPRASVEAVYIRIIDDYNKAVEYLKKTSVVRSDKSYIDASVARMLLARAYMCMGKYAEAAAECELVRSECGASLSQTIYTATDQQNRMSDIWNSEWMWGDIHSDDYNEYGMNRNWHDFLSNSYASYNRNSPRAILSTLYYSIPSTDVRKGLWVGNPFESGITLYLPRSGRKAMFMSQKFLVYDIYISMLEMDVPYMRYPEVLLTLAEAYARSGQESKAQQVVGELGNFRDSAYPRVSSNTGDALIEEILWQRRVELWGENGDRWLILKRLNKDLDRGSLPREGYNQGPYTSTKEATNLDPIASNFNMYGAGLNEDSRYIPAEDNRWQWLIPNEEINSNPLCTQNPY